MAFLYGEFLVASVVMGFSIGVDAAVVTALKAKALSNANRAGSWILGVSLTHTLFPMAGYLLTYFGLQLFPSLTPLMGVIAFALIAHFVWTELKAATQSHSHHHASHYELVSMGLILAVSWDALWSGPAKSSQALHWPELAIWLSFIIVGLVVCALAMLALTVARYVVSEADSKRHQRIFVMAQWLQLSTISYFGWLALSRYTFTLNVAWTDILVFSMVSTAVIFYGFKYQARQQKPALG